ncbi:MAG: Ppx/GppA family phosphatase [Candidatus Firestonebacteria bacterium]|nr:Ppx/GppA family phosphatase [Candidatus Firestonebacteria bacterium]
MLKASIDIGTNSVRLLIAEILNNKELKPILKKVDVVRLGAGVDKTKILSNEAMDRTINKLIEYKEILYSYKIPSVNIIATSAVRDSQNRNVFIDKFKKKLNWEFSTITGNEEASYTFLGVKSAFPGNKLLVFDIGGGSTEFIIENDKDINEFSINIGCVRMTERFIKKQPITPEEYTNLRNEIENQITSALSEIKLQNRILIGVAGTVTTLAAMDQELFPYDINKIHKYKLSFDHIEKLHENLKTKSVDQIKQIKGIHPARSDVILAGSLICLIIMKKLLCNYLLVSESELLEGIIKKNFKADSSLRSE